MADRYSPTPYDGSPRRDSRDRSPLNGRSSRSRSRSPRRPAKPVSSKRLYISNMPFDMKWKEIKDLFKEHVSDCYVTLYERPDGKSTGSGIIEFREVSKAQEAVDKMNRFEVAGRKIVVREESDRDRRRHAHDRLGERGGRIDHDGPMRGDDHRGRGPIGPGPNINPMNLPPGVTPQLLNQLGITEGPITNQVFVANLDYRVTETKLKEVFSLAGNVSKLEMKNDKDGKFRGMAVVAYETPLEALQAISMFNGQTLYDRNMSVKMDKLAYTEPSKPSLPEGLKGIGHTLPLGGPVMNMGGGMGPGPMGGGLGGGGGSMLGSMSSMGGGGFGMNSGDFNLGGSSGGLGGLGSLTSSGMSGNFGGSTGGFGIDTQLNSRDMSGIDLSNFANLAANLQNNPDAFNSLSNMMNNLAGGNSNMSAMLGGGSSGSGMMSNGRSSFGGRDDRLDRGMDRSRRSPPRGSDLRASLRGGGGDIPGDINSVFVRNLPFTFTWQMLKETFKPAGEVQYAEIKKDGDNKSRGFGIVRFTMPEDARRAVNLFNKTRLNGREIEVRLNQTGGPR